MEQVQKLIHTENVNADMTSYTIFLNLLAKILQRLVQMDVKNQVMKIIGRIFTKFGESKLFSLNEIGIHNFLTLFLTLASIVGTKEIVSFTVNFILINAAYTLSDTHAMDALTAKVIKNSLTLCHVRFADNMYGSLLKILFYLISEILYKKYVLILLTILF